MERILAIQIKRIGDLILTAPALTRLKRERPESRLTLVTLGTAGQLAPAIPAVDEHLNYRYRSLNPALWSRLLAGRFDVALDFNGSDRSAFMTFLSGAEIQAGYTKRAAGFFRQRVYSHTSNASLKGLHTIDHMTALLDAIGLPPAAEPEPLSLMIPVPIRDSVEETLRSKGVEGPFAVIHPGTARAEKYWRADRWASVADFVEAECGLQVVITGGHDPEEQRHIADICAGVGREPVVVAGELSLLETAAVIEQSSLALGVDTAAMHLAAAFEKPQVVLYGPTNPYHWRPRHGQARVLLAGNPEPLREDQLEIKTPKRRMKEILPGQVVAAIRSLR